MKKLMLALACLMGVATLPADAGEALITKVRGSALTIDAGTEGGLVTGLPVEIVRPPGESIIHPITGENLGAPEVLIGSGAIAKVAKRAANVRIAPGLLMAVRPGDIVRFVTPEEGMMIDQERSTASQEKNQEEHQGFRNEISRLTRSIRGVSGRIGGLEKMMKRVERVEEGFRVQLRGINTDVNTMKEDISNLKESVALMGSVPVEGLEGEETAGAVDLSSDESIDQIRDIVLDVLGQNQAQLLPATKEELELPTEDEMEMEEEVEAKAEEEEEAPFFLQTWFFGIIGALGIIGVAAFVYLRMMADGEEDEEDEEDEEIEDDDEDDDLDMDDMEIEEEDDIVVEETS